MPTHRNKAGAARPLPAPSATYTTREVAEYLGRPMHDVSNAARTGRVPPPRRNLFGRFLWTAEDVERLRLALGVDRRLKAHRRPRRGKVVTR
jgi:hypothetical protein